MSKTVGDIAGPCAFALLAGSARVLYARMSDRIRLERFMALCSVLGIFSYLLAALSPLPVLSLVGCALCGFANGVLWPGTFSYASKQYQSGGMALFALLALAGDLGCTLGPITVGFVSDLFGGNLRAGMLGAMIFPAVLLIALAVSREKKTA